MKRKPIGAFFLCIFLLTFSGLGQAQIIAPPPVPTPLDLGEEQLALEILMGLMGNYMAKMQEYQDVIAQDGVPDSVMKFRVAAKVIVTDGETDSESGSILTGMSQMAFWIKASIFNRYPNLIKIDLSGSLGDMEILITPTESIIVSRDEAVFSVLPPELDLPSVIPIGEVFPEEISDVDFDLAGSLELLQGQLGAILLENVSDVVMEYDGFEMTSRGMAHIVRLTSADTGEIITLWVLDETWDLCRVEFDDPGTGSATIIIEELEFVAPSLPDSVFDIDTASLAELPYEEFLKIIDLKFLSVGLIGTPVAADLSVSLPVVQRGKQVIVSSNGLDAEDEESDLVVQIEYMGPDGSWTPLEAVYAGDAPLGRWEAAFAPSMLGVYSFRVTYTDSLGAVSEPLELSSVLDVVSMPPQVVDVSPGDREVDVSASSQIVVTFNQEMDQASVESAFSLSDSSGQVVSGSFEWADSSCVFKPDQGLMYGQDYLAKISGTAMNLYGATLDADMDGFGAGSPEDDLVWRFTTEYAPLPKVAKFDPGAMQLNVLVSAQVSVTFTEIMDQASVENAFSLASSGGEVSGSFQWSDSTLTFIPAQSLEYNATYRVRVRGSATSALGIGLDVNGNGIADGSPVDDLSWWFSTEKFSVLAAKPASQTGLGGDFINVDIVAQSVAQLSSFTLTVDFDPAILKLLKVRRISFVDWRPRPKLIENVDVWQPTVIDKEQGLIVIAADSTRAGGVTGTGTIATLIFQAVGVGESPIELKDVSFVNAMGAAMVPDLRSGQVEILEFAPWDANKDGIVNILDFIIIQNDRGANTDVNGDGVTNVLDMVAAAGSMRASPTLAPTVNALFDNFPNPFNPETWIPYQIIKGDDVVISIYSATGGLVRTLDLGYQRAGRYATKSTAPYWDGNNEDGERVASGIYYYTIRSGDFSAVRKMVVSK